MFSNGIIGRTIMKVLMIYHFSACQANYKAVKGKDLPKMNV